MITATTRGIPPSTHPGTVAQAEYTLPTAAHRFDPVTLSRIGERLLAHLDPGVTSPASSGKPVVRKRRGLRTLVRVVGIGNF